LLLAGGIKSAHSMPDEIMDIITGRGDKNTLCDRARPRQALMEFAGEDPRMLSALRLASSCVRAVARDKGFLLEADTSTINSNNLHKDVRTLALAILMGVQGSNNQTMNWEFGNLLLHFGRGAVIVRPTPELVEAMVESEMNFQCEDYIPPFPYWMVDLPGAASQHFSQKFARVTIADLRMLAGYADKEPPAGCTVPKEEIRTISMNASAVTPFDWKSFGVPPDVAKGLFRHTTDPHSIELLHTALPIGYRRGPVEPMFDLLDAYSKNRPECGRPFTEDDRRDLTRIARLVIGLSNYLRHYQCDVSHPEKFRYTKGPRPGNTEPGVQVYDVGKEFTRNARRLASAVASGQKQENDEGRASPRPHWRKAHARRQPYGPGRQEIKLVWIHPAVIGLNKKEEDLEEEMA
jgi:hypothetical protein